MGQIKNLLLDKKFDDSEYVRKEQSLKEFLALQQEPEVREYRNYNPLPKVAEVNYKHIWDSYSDDPKNHHE